MTQGKESRLTKARVPEGDGLESLSALPASRESLDCRVIKTRVRGPQGRRLPRKSLGSFSSPAVRKTVKATIEKSEEDNEDELKECKEEEEREDEDELNNKAESTLSTLNEADANEEGSEKSRNGSTSSNSTTNNRLEKDKLDPSDQACEETESDSEELTKRLSEQENFDRAWFLSSPDPRSGSPSMESTSDYFSMHGNLNSSRSLSETPHSENHPQGKGGHGKKFFCCLL
jgi:flagellar biosynthesis GTPase FlhF